MGRKHRPRKGSMAFSPRKRARRWFADIDSWPDIKGNARIQGFAGYKVGMTHVLLLDSRKRSSTAGLEVQTPVTILEVPPLKVAGIRFYKYSPEGLRTIGEISATQVGVPLNRYLERIIPLPELKKEKGEKTKEDERAESERAESERLKKADELLKKFKVEEIDDVRLILYTQPHLVTGVPTKRPEIMEIRVAGEKISERVEYAKNQLIKSEVTIDDFAKEGDFIDVASITKGKGFQGHIKRWGVKRQPHKNSKHIRMVGTLGPHFPSYILPSVPQSGQVGFHQRTEYNKQLLKIGKKDEELKINGGNLHYGEIRTRYILLKGSVPGPAKRLIKLRDAMRPPKTVIIPEITYVSLESKQGV